MRMRNEHIMLGNKVFNEPWVLTTLAYVVMLEFFAYVCITRVNIDNKYYSQLV